MKKIFILFSCLLVQITSYGFDSGKTKNLLQKSQAKAFYENVGQVVDQNGNSRNDIQFQLIANNMSVFVSSGQLQYQFIKPSNGCSYRLDVSLVGANKNTVLVKGNMQPAYNNYYANGAEKTAHSYTKLVYQDVYPNIDWILYTKDNQLEYDFVVHPGGDVSNIQLRYDGATGIKKTIDGSIVARTPLGTVTEHAPRSYAAATKQPVSSKFVLKNNTISFATGKHDGDLVIDPVLNWATYYGGTAADQVFSVTCDRDSNIYIAGTAASTANIATVNSFQAARSGTTSTAADGFIAKFNSAGVRQWATYIGGVANSSEIINGITCDANGNIYVVGASNTPAGAISTNGSHQLNPGGNFDVFVAQFNSAGQRQWATFYGGTAVDRASGILLNNGYIYIAGYTQSATAIATPGSVQDTLFGAIKAGSGTAQSDAFLAKFSTAGVRQWGTYYGTAYTDQGLALCGDKYNKIYLAGYATLGDTLLTTPNSHQRASLGSTDAFLVKFNDAGVREWATYYGGEGTEQGLAVKCDSRANVYLAGYTQSATNISTADAHQIAQGSYYSDGLLVKFDSAGRRQWATYYGGSTDERINAVICDAADNVYITGNTNSTQNIASPRGYKTTFSGGSNDAYIAKFLSNGTRAWGTYYGGTNSDYPTSIILNADTLYVGGYTNGLDGIVTTGAHQTTYGGSTNDGFLAKFSVLADTTVYIARSFADTILCRGRAFELPYITTNNFNTGNTFSVELSDVQGNFTNPIVIGTVTATASGTITCTIPANMTPDTAYRVRITASNIPAIAATNFFRISINEVTPISVTVIKDPGSAIAAGQAVKFTAYVPYTTTQTSYQWIKNDTALTGETNPTCTINSLIEGDKVYVLVHNPFPCTLADSIYSDTTSIHIIGTDTNTSVSNVVAVNGNIKIYPSPNNGSFTISGKSASMNGQADIIIMNAIGQVVYTNRVAIEDGKIHAAMQLEHLPAGMYMVQLRDDRQSYGVSKFIIQR